MNYEKLKILGDHITLVIEFEGLFEVMLFMIASS